MSELHDMPCGSCDCGTYAVGAFLAGLETFGGMQSQKQALRAAPQCKHEKHICFGARDFILSCDWPLDDARVAEMRRQALS